MFRRLKLAVACLLLTTPAFAQPAGFRYSDYPDEGDRAAMGCSAETNACISVRCEDDFTVGLYLDSYREGGDVGRWRISIDAETFEVQTVPAANTPYVSRIEGDVTAILDGLKQGSVAYIEALQGDDIGPQQIPLTGSLYVINQALYYCAPRALPDGGAEQGPDAGGNG